MSAPAAVPLTWLAAHEARLAWRDWQGMVTAGNKRRLSTALIVMLAVAVLLHVPAYYLIGDFGAAAFHPDKAALFSVTLVTVLFASLLLSQAMETVTRSLYSRGDLDLVLSSPVAPARLFAVRIFANAALIAGVALLLSAPLLDVLVFTHGPIWLAGFVVAATLGFTAGAIAVAITLALFRLFGPRRTRIIAQVIAAIIGASFAIGIQVIAIVNYGTLSRRSFLTAPETLARLPPAESLLWLPARAAMGDPAALALFVSAGALIVALVTAAYAPRLGAISVAATDLVPAHRRNHQHQAVFRVRPPAAALRRKEWQLLRRDPWLISQTLTQLLYLVPPAILLIHNFSSAAGVIVVVVMVMVSVGGQLAGALAWLTISGEDAPDMIATAPVGRAAVTRAKVEAVMGAVAIMLGPLVLALAILSPTATLIAALGVVLAAASTIQIQLWFRAQARRSNFRRRHSSSRIATFAEALVSFSWAAAAGLLAMGTWLAAFSAAVALIILMATRAVSPRKALA